MGLLSNKVEKTQIKAGDHIYTWRVVYTYSHHGIYVGGSKVAHFTREQGGSSSTPLLDLLFQALSFHLPIQLSLTVVSVRGGTCTTATSDPPQTVVHRAMLLLQNGFGNYNIFQNNCEDFALYCRIGLLILEKTGIGRSGQASSVLSAPIAALISSPLKMLMAGPVGVATVTAGMYCVSRYGADMGVRTDVVKVAFEQITLSTL